MDLLRQIWMLLTISSGFLETDEKEQLEFNICHFISRNQDYRSYPIIIGSRIFFDDVIRDEGACFRAAMIISLVSSVIKSWLKHFQMDA